MTFEEDRAKIKSLEEQVRIQDWALVFLSGVIAKQGLVHLIAKDVKLLYASEENEVDGRWVHELDGLELALDKLYNALKTQETIDRLNRT